MVVNWYYCVYHDILTMDSTKAMGVFLNVSNIYDKAEFGISEVLLLDRFWPFVNYFWFDMLAAFF